MEIQVVVTDLVMGLLGKTSQDVARSNIIPGCPLIKIGEKPLDSAQLGVSFAVSQTEGFLVIFDSDYGDISVVQKTYRSEADVNKIYGMLSKMAVPNKSYPQADGFFIESESLGYIFIEKQNLDGRPCIMASLESILYE